MTPGSWCAVEPGDAAGPAFFAHDEGGRLVRRLADVRIAITHAAWLSAGGSTQRVVLTDDGTSRVLREYEGGRETFLSREGLLPLLRYPAAVVPGVGAVITEGERARPRKARKQADPDLPPCEQAEPDITRTRKRR